MTGLIVVALAGSLGLLLCVLVARAFRQWQGWWRWLVLLPFLGALAIVINIATAIWMDPTAHNLWPIELIAYFLAANVVVALIYLLHWFGNRARAGENTSKVQGGH
jgi:hypothetical protein